MITQQSLFFVFLGVQTANYVAENLHVQLTEALNEIVQQKNDESVHCSELNHEKLYEAIKKTFLQLDQQMKQLVKDDSGCVCVSYRLAVLVCLIASFNNLVVDVVVFFFISLDIVFDWT